MKGNALRIALCQLRAQSGYPPDMSNIKKAIKKIRERKVDLMVFPEMSTGIFSTKYPPSLLATHYEKLKKSIEGLCQGYHIDVVICLWEPCNSREKAYNTAVLITKEGKSLLSYRKLHLFDSLGMSESSFISPGQVPPPIIDYKGFKLSVSICYDLRFPELYRYQSKAGTELSLVCSGWYQGILKETHLHTMLQSRAIENTMYVLCANLCGKGFCGRSSAFDPYGVKMGEIGEKEDIIVVEVSKTRLQEIRQNLPCLSHTRNDVFP